MLVRECTLDETFMVQSPEAAGDGRRREDRRKTHFVKIGNLRQQLPYIVRRVLNDPEMHDADVSVVLDGVFEG